MNTVLRASTALAALVGTRIRIAPLSPTDALPAISFQSFPGPRDRAMGSDTGNYTTRMQVNSWGTTYASASAVRDQVRAALQRYRGSTDVDDTYLQRESSQYDADNKVHGIQQDYIIHFRE